MDVVTLKEKLINDTDLLIEVLEKFGFHHVKIIRNEIRCSHELESNPTAVRISTENLSANCYSKSIKGDIFTLLQWKSGMNFYDTFNRILSIIGDEEVVITERKSFFGGKFRQFIGKVPQKDGIYDEKEVNSYEKIPNLRFLQDNISIRTQKHFDIRYDRETDYIAIIWRNIEGKIVGVKGRRNSDDEEKVKYFALKQFQKTQHLYGFHENYNEIIKERKIFIFEAEKSVMQAHTFGIPLGVAVGSHDIDEQQIRHLKFNVDEAIICYDKDVELNVVLEQAKRIKNQLGIKVGYIYDEENLLGEKDSPTDKGRAIFLKLLENTHYIGDDMTGIK